MEKVWFDKGDVPVLRVRELKEEILISNRKKEERGEEEEEEEEDLCPLKYSFYYN